MKKFQFPMGEAAFFLAVPLSAAGIALQTKADLGLSMVAAPAYLLSLRIPWLTFGMSECLVQGLLFLLCCLWIRNFPYKKLWSFAAAIPYGWVLDQMLALTTRFHPDGFLERLVLFFLGSVLLAAGISLFVKSYFPCQVYEMFVKCISEHLNRPFSHVKAIYDWSSLSVSVVLSLLFFHGLRGIGIGTILCTVINAPLIGGFSQLFDHFFDFRPAFPQLTKFFK